MNLLNPQIAVVGRGRLGTLLAAELDCSPALGRGESPAAAEVVLLCVPDDAIASVAAELPLAPGTLVGHCSGATTLEPLVAAGHEAFSLHPLMTVTEGGAVLRDAWAAIAGSTPRALELARTLATRLGMRPFAVADEDRAAYHASASIASNFLVTLEAFAERIGTDREQLAPLVRATVENWAELGAARALTGPVARGDERTVARQRAAVAARAPEALELFDELAHATRRLAAEPETAPSPSHPSRARSALTAGSGTSPRRDGDGDRLPIVRTIAELRALLADGPRPVGLVPTMGALHAGHAALIEAAAASCPQVVVSVFVNPTQFDEAGDYELYPRDERRDAATAARAGATVLFAPDVAELYPAGFATTVQVGGALTETLEGRERGTAHFAGVATVVTKLLNIVRPQTAFFGQKDAQQALVIERLVADLDIDVAIEVLPTVREPDGLALSSRNVRLSTADRQRAPAIARALRAAGDVLARSGDANSARAAGIDVLRAAGIEPDYLEIADRRALSPLDRVNGEGALIAVAARVGDVRLIDNLVIAPSPTQKEQR